MKDPDKCLDPQLWHACAGGMVHMPPVHSKVYYFLQGHAEHAVGPVDFGSSLRIPALILCRVVAVKFMADPESDEVFAKIRLAPLKSNEPNSSENDELRLGCNGADVQEKPPSFAKTLTQSDANNGGGFSVPRYCAETIFPRLDYSAEPPVQTVLAKDVHGEVWKFRHIYRGTPRRHLLTTGWSAFVNQKKLVAGDSIVFLRTETGELCIGVRRAKQVFGGSSAECLSGWNPPSYAGISVFIREEGSKQVRNGRVRPESVIEAARLAAGGQPFEVVYYPRASTPEFVVKAMAVRAAMRVQWRTGMRFKMAFETEDSSRISWFMGTISSVQVADPIRWPCSPWRILQVTWDEPELLQNVKCVSPWLVELVSPIPAIHLPPFSPPRKKLRIPPYPDFPLKGQLPNPVFPGNPLGHSNGVLCCFPDTTSPAGGIQGARHAQLGISPSDLHLSTLQSSAFPAMSTGITNDHPPNGDTISCVLTLGTVQSTRSPENGKTPHIVLFGKPILTEQQMSMSSNSPDQALNSCEFSELGLETGHCKVFLESEDAGCTLDLSMFKSYEELYRRLGNMFRIEKSVLMSRVLYGDAAGVVKHAGDEPFSEFAKTATRLTILSDAGGKDAGNRRTSF